MEGRMMNMMKGLIAERSEVSEVEELGHRDNGERIRKITEEMIF